ncbi:MAG: TIGR01212 family radical SAM protein [Prevotellaceae bacterium]|jgi:radical SAM protein (TIGR01212 family)|nr:TIGR01212 family radical SAM protein [Prevotellaceae bacterium]
MNNKILRPPYNDFSTWIHEVFPDRKVQKISVDAGFTCPNRDGTLGRGGCTYCDNRTFNPDYCRERRTIAEQLEAGKRFFGKKYPEMKYLAYFQAYTNTYATMDELRRKYEEALSVPDVVGLVIGTRPDCMPDELLDYLSHLSVFVLVEYGIESTDDRTLCRINRGHTYAQTADAIRRTAERRLPVGGHVILGLPGETRENLIEQAERLSELPLSVLKIHQLQLIRGTRMAEEYARHPEDFYLFGLDDYINTVIDYLEHLNPDFIIERFVSQSPPELLIAPDWGLKNYQFTARLLRRMNERGTWQGRLLTK